MTYYRYVYNKTIPCVYPHYCDKCGFNNWHRDKKHYYILVCNTSIGNFVCDNTIIVDGYTSDALNIDLRNIGFEIPFNMENRNMRIIEKLEEMFENKEDYYSETHVENDKIAFLVFQNDGYSVTPIVQISNINSPELRIDFSHIVGLDSVFDKIKNTVCTSASKQ